MAFLAGPSRTDFYRLYWVRHLNSLPCLNVIVGHYTFHLRSHSITRESFPFPTACSLPISACCADCSKNATVIHDYRGLYPSNIKYSQVASGKLLEPLLLELIDSRLCGYVLSEWSAIYGSQTPKEWPAQITIVFSAKAESITLKAFRAY